MRSKNNCFNLAAEAAAAVSTAAYAAAEATMSCVYVTGFNGFVMKC